MVCGLNAAGLIEHRFSELCRVGHGVTSKVYSARASDGSKVALKMLSVAELRRQLLHPVAYDSVHSPDMCPPPPPPLHSHAAVRTAMDCLVDEVNLMSSMHHPNIVSYLAVLQNQKRVVIVMPFFPAPLLNPVASVAPEMNLVWEPTPLPLASDRFRQMLGALGYMHANHVAHFDVKIDNIRLDGSGHPMFIDFGNFRQCDTESRVMGPYGAIAFSPPESFSGAFVASAADIWALGIVICAVLSGRLPFDLLPAPSKSVLESSPLPSESVLDYSSSPMERSDESPSIYNERQLISEIRQGRVRMPSFVLSTTTDNEPRWVPIPTALSDLLHGMLAYDPGKRLTASMALEHPWWQLPAMSKEVQSEVTC